MADSSHWAIHEWSICGSPWLPVMFGAQSAVNVISENHRLSFRHSCIDQY